jgi:hypothetical protein
MAQPSASPRACARVKTRSASVRSAPNTAGVRVGSQVGGDALVLPREFDVAVVAKVRGDPIRRRDGAQEDGRRNARRRGESFLLVWVFGLH